MYTNSLYLWIKYNWELIQIDSSYMVVAPQHCVFLWAYFKQYAVCCVNMLLTEKAETYALFFHSHYCFGTWCHLVAGGALESNRQRSTQQCNMLKTESRSSQLDGDAESQPAMLHKPLQVEVRNQWFPESWPLLLNIFVHFQSLSGRRPLSFNCSDYSGQIRPSVNSLGATGSRACPWKYFPWQESQSHGKVNLLELAQNDSVQYWNLGHCF